MVVLALAVLLTQEVRPLPDHVTLTPSAKDKLTDRAKRIFANWKLYPPKTLTFAPETKTQSQSCATMVVIPTDPSIDPKMAIEPKNAPNMPLYTGGLEPCYNKLP